MKFKRNNDLIAADLDEDLVMLDMEQGMYFSLNPIGKRIWELLENQLSMEELSAALLEEYEISEEECQQDVKQLLDELLQLKLIKSV